MAVHAGVQERPFQHCIGNALAQLEQAGIVNRLNERKWGRAWECDELLDLVSAFEKDISTP